MKNNRRSFIKLAGIAAAGLALAPKAMASSVGGSPVKADRTALTAKHWGMVIDTTKLNTKEAIEALGKVCHAIHNVPTIAGKQEVKWLWPAPYDQTFIDQENPYLSEDVHIRQYALLCNHCKNPPCVRVCPTKATYKRPDGIVDMDYHRCIGCRYCMAGCPYGSRSFNWGEPRDHLDLNNLNKEYPTRMRGVVEKCNFCVERLAVGKLPACVEASEGAMFFGDLSDPNSEVRQVLRERFTIRRSPGAGTEPSVFYII
ncbi:MAG: 4Fe-4S dicluster domain-containing protein [Pseudodesulfovibrio sp.]|uniref:4Fe-4S ferredoxin iron-sulfur binding domain protein n=1 Tax=Pseudodesulfovibrio aespoeensis (strain ATCC 700646 / DSM 10631 / Aspo-2) TaxID=643562 RepID=E6VWY7_PSEA9|nr:MULTISPECIES: 4Fe-4S dicluster domain-containing protein [Pseudodesulfovibrio]MBU4244789.1 4Fe-4S dicluster domain-containing protein [Pseudomonadota bacterium]ADU61393.1 4Fe-4S ferredoxin iron-sulfur binding domain protein [Pseudodesulfovibrio aespoeensis Aspo-2]MBU4474786.1 4Fe-4S dicluster domain-containing protein [Pseudomonadota bacterium]MBU4516344.1 4Fe-4S dicluster domain-containing protein [Pseudomonadota bacterium]MBU4522525.1 4Fe-4S dicluster domain-containing protein [Pseudomona